MKTISILSQKGGAGKTTLAINFAGAAEAAGQDAVIIDLDPQASAKSWYDRRGKENPVVISAQAAALNEVLATAATHGADYAIIDTAPHSGNGSPDGRQGSRPYPHPLPRQLRRLESHRDHHGSSEAREKPAMFVLSCIRPGDKALPDGAESHLAQHSIPVSPQRITQRAAVVHALTAGQSVTEFEPNGAAAGEIRALFEIASNHVGV